LGICGGGEAAFFESLAYGFRKLIEDVRFLKGH
jgi:hypothetical protein